MAGRDIGTEILPKADLKVYWTPRWMSGCGGGERLAALGRQSRRRMLRRNIFSPR